MTGLVSVSFRHLSPEEVVKAAVGAGLRHIEWGSDVHAPWDDPVRLKTIVQLQAQYGVRCCSYGTYFRLGMDPVEQLPGYIRAAKQLGTDVLRLWAGKKSPWEVTPEERAALFADCRAAARLAEDAGVKLCLECHKKTYTETKEAALELLQAVDSSAFGMYWQPNQSRTIEENLEYARTIKDYVNHIHVFQWKGKERFPLSQGIEEWKAYLAQLPGEHMYLLEFMPDDDEALLPAEANSLRQILGR